MCFAEASVVVAEAILKIFLPRKLAEASFTQMLSRKLPLWSRKHCGSPRGTWGLRPAVLKGIYDTAHMAFYGILWTFDDICITYSYIHKSEYIHNCVYIMYNTHSVMYIQIILHLLFAAVLKISNISSFEIDLTCLAPRPFVWSSWSSSPT